MWFYENLCPKGHTVHAASSSLTLFSTPVVLKMPFMYRKKGDWYLTQFGRIGKDVISFGCSVFTTRIMWK
jgi:hypothetical protein